MKFKEPKTVTEQIDYLKKEKRVIFKEITEAEATVILEKYGYINVITPFKHRFAKKENGKVIKSEGKHVYDRDVDFSEYFNFYKNERKTYSDLYSGISKFEITFNAVVSNIIAKEYNLDSESSFDLFISDLKSNLSSNTTMNSSAKKRAEETIDSLKSQLEKYGSIFIFLDHCMLNTIITIYKHCSPQIKKTIFDKLLSLNSTLGYPDENTFDDALSRLVSIRNYVFHHDSLTVLLRYYDIKENKLRGHTYKKKYKTLLKRLL